MIQQMIHKYEMINLLIAELKIDSYLEIGLGPLQETWKWINCDHKECVDIDRGDNNLPTFLGTSDDFFNQNTREFGLIYIDGDHRSEQVRKDLINSLLYLQPGGVIVMHDIAPRNREQIDPRSSGDAFKVFIEIQRNPHLVAHTHFFPDGDAAGVVWRGKNENPFTAETSGDEFDFYLHHKDQILSPLDIKEIIKKIKSAK